METTVDLTIKGLCLCFFKDQFWNVLFLSDDEHPARLQQEDVAVKDFSITGRDIDINFVGNGVMPRQEDPFGENSDLLFDLSGDYAHGTDDQGRSNLTYKRTKTAGRDLVWMKIPESTLRVEKIIGRDYYVQEQNFPGAPVEIIGRVAQEVVIGLVINENVPLMMSDRDNPQFEQELLMLEASGETISLVFDNDCQQQCKHNDFLDIYEVVEDKRIENGVEIEVKFAGGQVKQTLFNGKRVVMDLTSASPVFNENGNCEVLGTKPPKP